MSNKTELTKKQKLFCLEYLANGYNATQAAIKAGYSAKTARNIGNENLTKPAIKEFIEKRMKKIEEKIEATIEWKVKMLKTCAEKCLQGEADRDGLIHPSGIVSAIAELNKMQGHYAPEKSINVHADADAEETSSLIKQYEREY